MSTIHDALETYLALRRELGSQMRGPAARLRRFVEFLDREKASVITIELALRWSMSPADAASATWAQRLGDVRRFAAWLSATDSQTEVPPQGLLSERYPRRPPYIYSDEEVARVVREAARLPSPMGLRASTYATLFGLLAATGLRIAEALALDRDDVDLRSGILRVRCAKFGKSRFVPVHDSTRRALRRYEKRREALLPRPSSPAFLLSERGMRVTQCSARYNFAVVSRRSRNARLATALRAFFSYVALSEPAHALHCQRVLAIPSKRFERGIVEFLDDQEIQALLRAPNPATWIGRRDRAILLLAVQTGLRVSELTVLRRQDVTLGAGAHVRCLGKGRKLRCTPLRSDVTSILEAWLHESSPQTDDPLFPSSRGGHMSADAVERLVAKHVAVARQDCPSLVNKLVTPHTLRHTAAMQLLQKGVDRSVIALWLGHESIETTQVYLHADLRLKEKALAHTNSSGQVPGRYRPGDALLTFLDSL